MSEKVFTSLQELEPLFDLIQSIRDMNESISSVVSLFNYELPSASDPFADPGESMKAEQMLLLDMATLAERINAIAASQDLSSPIIRVAVEMGELTKDDISELYEADLAAKYDGPLAHFSAGPILFFDLVVYSPPPLHFAKVVDESFGCNGYVWTPSSTSPYGRSPISIEAHHWNPLSVIAHDTCEAIRGWEHALCDRAEREADRLGWPLPQGWRSVRLERDSLEPSRRKTNAELSSLAWNHLHENEAMTIRELAKKLECSIGRVATLPAWKDLQKKRKTARVRNPKPNTLSISKIEPLLGNEVDSEALDAKIDADEKRSRDAAIAKLTAEQRVDYEPSPCNETSPYRKKVYSRR